MYLSNLDTSRFTHAYTPLLLFVFSITSAFFFVFDSFFLFFFFFFFFLLFFFFFFIFFFFFQAEDGIRDIGVTGVQTCALPICDRASSSSTSWKPGRRFGSAPMSPPPWTLFWPRSGLTPEPYRPTCPVKRDRKSTRLNSSHANISYAVFCLKKKKQTTIFHNIYE